MLAVPHNSPRTPTTSSSTPSTRWVAAWALTRDAEYFISEGRKGEGGAEGLGRVVGRGHRRGGRRVVGRVL